MTFLGVFPSSPMTGMMLWSIGDTLKIPIGGWPSILLITFNMCITTPAFIRQFYERGWIVAEWFIAEDERLKDYVHKKSVPHHLMNFLTFVGASIEAGVF